MQARTRTRRGAQPDLVFPHLAGCRQWVTGRTTALLLSTAAAAAAAAAAACAVVAAAARGVGGTGGWRLPWLPGR
jgi:hypothetical protein